MTLQKIAPHEVEKLADLCRQIYVQVYPYLWFDDGSWYMETRYNATQLLTEIMAENTYYAFILDNDRAVGHLKLNLNDDSTSAQNNSYGDSQTDMYHPLTGNGLELERIYLLEETAGKGLGRKVLDEVFAMARSYQKDYVWLHAMDSSPALKFYEKYGFQICGETLLPFEKMKPQYRRMVKMWKQVINF
jgi:diamine N-acetyltransferase